VAEAAEVTAVEVLFGTLSVVVAEEVVAAVETLVETAGSTY
jgi:Zn finger protein HypA/HybF involved in hydrogenase expression